MKRDDTRREIPGVKIQTKRVYEPVEPGDGYRALVDRMWPRGLTKSRVQCDVWLKDIAPSPELRKWFDHDPARWREFGTRYFKELSGNQDVVAKLVGGNRSTVTLIYAAKDTQFNHAIALKSYLDKRFKSARKTAPKAKESG